NGACVIEAPEIFDLDDEGELVVLKETPSEDQRAELEAAVRMCPKHALRIEG
ncbi:MAG: ferredoxin, partial [Rhodobiaceae bacterium]|nr:ferredoxin [Rhodobiaceae bacterium]